MNGTWTAAFREHDLTLGEDIPFTKLTLVENYNTPDSCLIEGPFDWVRVGIESGSGVVVWDENGVQRFSGVLNTEEMPSATDGALPYFGDLVHLWWRICYPTPTANWNAQTVAYDVQTASPETRAIGYITRNASATHSIVKRRTFGLRIPTSGNRGTSGKTSARFQTLGELVAQLCESASLRVVVGWGQDGAGPHLQLGFLDAPDMSAVARFGTINDGGPGLLGPDVSFKNGMPEATALLSAAGGELENRLLTELDKAAAPEVTPWGYRIEKLVDQRNSTTDAPEIAEGLDAAWLESSGVREVAASIAYSDLELGTDIPIGAKVAATVRGYTIVERVRRLTTTISKTDSGATKTVEPVFGSPDAPLVAPTPQQLRQWFKRVQELERN